MARAKEGRRKDERRAKEGRRKPVLRSIDGSAWWFGEFRGGWFLGIELGKMKK
jgi:hypothetical protein